MVISCHKMIVFVSAGMVQQIIEEVLVLVNSRIKLGGR